MEEEEVDRRETPEAKEDAYINEILSIKRFLASLQNEPHCIFIFMTNYTTHLIDQTKHY